MNTQLIPVSLIFLSAVYAGVGLLIWMRRPGLAITSFAWMMFSVAIWSLGHGLELLTPSLSGKMLWLKIGFSGVSSVAVFLFSFCAAYTGRNRVLSSRNLILLGIIPIVTILLTWTNQYHQLIWKKINVWQAGSLSLLETEYGNWFWVQVAYSYTLTTLAAFFLIVEVFQSPRPYNYQAGIVLLGILIPWAGGFLYLSGMILPGLDITPFTFLPIVFLLAWRTLRYRLLGILPTAPSMILHELQDGVVVIDNRKRILYLNNLAEQILQISAKEALGQLIDSLQVACLETLQNLIDEEELYSEQELTLNEQKRIFEIRVSPLSKKEWGTNSTDVSHLVLFRDIHQRKQVELNLQRRQGTLNQLQEIVASALKTNDRHTMAHVIVNNLNQIFDADGIFLSLWDDVSETFTPLAANGQYSQEFMSLTINPDEATLTVSALEAERTLVVDNISDTPYLSSRIAALLPFTSVMTLPLIADQKKLGAILLEYSDFHHFQPEEIKIGEQAAGLIALTLEKFYAVDEANQRAEEAELLRKAGAAVAATKQLEDALDRILEQLAMFVPYESASVQLLYDNEVEIVGGRGWKNPEEILGMRLPIPGDNPNTVVIETGKPYTLADAQTTHYCFNNGSLYSHIRSWLGSPLNVHGNTIGLLAIDSTEADYFTGEHVETVTKFADQVAIGLENARLIEEIQKQLQSQIMVREVSSIVSSALTIEKVLALLTEQICNAVDATSVYINEYSESENAQIVIAEHFSANACEKERVSDIGKSWPWEEVEKEFIELMEAGEHDYSLIDDPEVPQAEIEHMQEFGAKSILHIPLRIKGKLIGFAEIWESRYIREFSVDEINICHLIMQQAAIAIENARLFEKVQNLALTDSLTGLYNRRGLFEIGHIEFSRNQRLERPFSVIMLDIDRFKRVNDQYGHPVGDQVLQFLASELRSSVRGVDILGRYGGEEFVIFLSGSDGNVAMELAERLRTTIETTPVHVEENQIEFTISLGVAETDKNSPTLETLVARADQALYVAKHKGRNCVVLGN